MLIDFHLDVASGVPTYVQLVHQVQQAVRLGLLKPGDQLPTAAAVVAALAINPNTVLKAYRELEREGVVQPRPGVGTFVTGLYHPVDPHITAKFRRSMATWLRSARSAGLGPDEIEAIFRTSVRDLYQEDIA